MAIKTQGTELYFVDPDGSSDGITKVGCVVGVNGLGGPRDQIETTCLNLTARTYESGLPTPGQVTLNLNFDPSDDTHERLHELYRSGEKVDWALGWSDGSADPVLDSDDELDPPTSRTWLVFNGYVADVPFDFTLNSVVTTAIPVQMSGFAELFAKT